MKCIYPNFERESRDRNLEYQTMADALGITLRCFKNKLSGVSPISWPQVCLLQTVFFPGMTKEYLFAREKQK